MSADYRFTVDPKETEDSRNVRWDKQLLELQATGYTTKGCGPDGDYPLRYEPNPYDLGGPFVEIYEIVPLDTPAVLRHDAAEMFVYAAMTGDTATYDAALVKRQRADEIEAAND